MAEYRAFAATESRVRSSILSTAREALEPWSDRMCEIVELRYHSGLSIQETAEILGISETTVSREWEVARIWMAKALGKVRKPEE